ncbi:IS1 family transposase, partial [Cronobacter sakazakii]
MKKRFSDEQIISILREAEAGVRRTVVAHVFGERTLATLERLLSLLSAFEVVVWMTDGWPLYEPRLKGKLHVISKRYTQRIERHNLNLR